MTEKIASVQTADLPAHVDHVVTFESGLKITAIRRNRHDVLREQLKAPRIYGALDTLVPHLMEVEPHTDKAIPVDPTDPQDVQDAKEWKSWKRTTLKEAKARLLPILSLIADREVQPNEVTFSVKAGCSCPCSPGFVYKGGSLGHLDYYFSEA